METRYGEKSDGNCGAPSEGKQLRQIWRIGSLYKALSKAVVRLTASPPNR
jgi:hypothetical protein